MSTETKKLPLPALLGAAAAVVLAVIAGFFLWPKGGEESYRTIQVYDINGTAQVTRQTTGTLQAYVRMMLQSGDHVTTEAESYLQLLLDSDKYVLVEPESAFSLEAAGTARNTQTMIHLEKGAIVNRIENKLNEGESYQVTTPNSTMAVRGTTFRVSVEFDENGVSHTLLSTFDGIVEIRLVYPDGTISDTPVLVPAGIQVRVRGDAETSEYEIEGEPIDFDPLNNPVLSFLDSYQIRFVYDGEMFAVCQVLDGQPVPTPAFMPTPSGHWDFEPGTVLNRDAEISWIPDAP